MANKTLFVKIGTPNWIPEIHQQGPIVTPMELPTKVVLTLVRKGHKLTAVNKLTKEEVKLNVLNATDPFKGNDEPKKEKVEAVKEKPISTNIGAPVVETVQPKVVEASPVVEEAPVETVEETVVAEEVAPVEEVVAEEAPVEVEEKPAFNGYDKKHKNKNNNFKK